MASCAQRKRQKKEASKRRFQTALVLKRESAHTRGPAASPQSDALSVGQPQTTEPNILSEDVGKLADIGVPQITITCLRRGGIDFIRGIPARGKAGLLETRGLGEARLTNLERALRTHGVVIPA